MNNQNINLSKIEKSSITVLLPFIYDQKKIKQSRFLKQYQIKQEHLKDFLPYTKNFFGNYTITDSETSSKRFPSVYTNNIIDKIEFIKDSKITTEIDINSIKYFLFEKSIGVLSITYNLPENITDEEYLIYHHKLSTIEKRNKQNLKDSNNIQYKYYYEFIDSLLINFCDKLNIFSRSNLYTYNLMVAKNNDQEYNSQNFLEPLSQYRSKLNILETLNFKIHTIQQIHNIHTVANENVAIHIALKDESNNDTFIDQEFFNKYENNHFLTYIIALYQTTMIEHLIVKAFLYEDEDKDLQNMRKIKNDILYFMANGNFTKISNNSIRNNLYKFYRSNFEIQNLIEEIDTVADKITNELETLHQDKQTKRDEMRNLILAIVGVVLAVIQIIQAI